MDKSNPKKLTINNKKKPNKEIKIDNLKQR